MNIVKVYKKYKDKFYIKILFAILIAFILELTLFNYKHYTNLFNRPIDLRYTSIEENDNSTIVKTRSFNESVKNIYFDIDYKEDNYINKIEIYATDESNELLTKIGETDYSNALTRSKYTYVTLDGKSTELKFVINSKSSNITINKITINNNIPIMISYVRVLIIIISILLYYCFNPKSKLYKIRLLNKPILYILPLVIMESLIIYGLSINSNKVDTINEYNELTTAIVGKHQIYIDEEPDIVIKNMNNPYDTEYRNLLIYRNYNRQYDTFDTREDLETKVSEFYKNSNIDINKSAGYKWDIAYYKGKFYVYFGIGPVLTTYIPYRLITKKWLGTYKLLYPLLIITTISFIYLIYSICKRYFKDISLALFYILAFVSLNGIGIFGMAENPSFYEIPFIYSMICLFTSLGIIINIFDSKKKNTYILFFISGILLSFISLCRPSFLFAGVLALPFLFNRLFNKDIPKKRLILEVVLFIIPFIINAIICCTYNYIRFDSIFEFGASYQLTLSDCLHRSSSINKIPPIIEYFLFMPPNIIGSFPYIVHNNFDTTYIGFMPVEYIYGGAFLTHLLLLSNIYIHKNKKKIDKLLYIFSILSLIIGILTTILVGIKGGLIKRYQFDFMYLLYIPAIISIITILNNSKKEYKNIILKLVLIASITTCLYMLYQSFTGQGVLTKGVNDYIYYSFKYLFNL